jgi:PAS domain S-box-containing protein
VMEFDDGPVEVLWQDGERLYRRIWRDMGDGSRREFLAAQPCAEHPTQGTVNRLAHEYGLKDYLDSEWALHPLELVRERGQTMLVLEPTRARPLDEMIGPGLPIGTFLRLAIAATNAVARLHHCGLVHKDIRASNILVDPASGDARLTGFSIASRLPRERQPLEPPELIAGTLSHMAPEQTGRMNRSIDSRSDLYSLGITLYQALTGSLPFKAQEPMEWVHCHIARKPPPPKSGLEEIPRQLATIVMKLLAKTPEERYQTAAGLEHDLRRCRDDWDSRGAIAEFPLGERDHSDRLVITEKLYGREREIATLLAAFDAAVASARPRLVLVSGYSGIGKSSVVGELHRALVPARGLFASGKFDQLKRDVPYATLAQAFRGLSRQLLAKPEGELTWWREQLCLALNPNGALATDLIPELKFVIGEQPPVPDIPPAAAKARVQMTLRRLIGVFAQAEHPLALFLDDLQWVDGATLDLLENILAQPEPQHLVLVGAYRNNEVDATHPLMRKLSVIRESGATVEEVVLGPLEDKDLTEWFADALRCQPERTIPLAELVRAKTAGNPFFANQFLQELLADDLITFDASDTEWRWDLGRIRSKGYTENVVDLMVGKLTRLPRTTQEALRTLACLGNAGSTSTLALVHGTSDEQLDSDLWEALRLELIVRSDDLYRFVHDRVQEAAYSLLPQEQRAPSHHLIGRLLAAQIVPERREEDVFEIVGHFNRATTLLTDTEERYEVAMLNLVAGKRAKKAGAFASALRYLVEGAALVEDDGGRRRDLAFELGLQRAECEFLTGDVTSAEQHLRILSLNAANVIERCAVACLEADVYFAIQQAERGLSACFECLQQAGLDIPLRASAAEAAMAYDKLFSKLGGIGIDEVAALPSMADAEARSILEVLRAVHSCAAAVSEPGAVVTVCAAIDLILERGIHDTAPHAFAQLGYLAAWRFNDFESAFRFGQLGYELIERRGLFRFEGLVCLNVSTLVMPWARHVTRCRSVIRRIFEVAHNTGDPYLPLAGGNVLLSNLLLGADPLPEVEREAEICLTFCRTGSYGDYSDALNTQVALIRSLRGLTPQFGLLDDQRFDERQIENGFSTQPHIEALECWYWIRKLQARFFAGDYATALDASHRAKRSLTKSAGMLELAEHELYGALTRAALCDSPSSDEGRQHFVAIVAHHRQLEIWARHCPENFENRSLLVAAEIARIEGRDPDAMQLYEQAIRSARNHGFVNNEALAHEIAARFYADRGLDRIARTYLEEARDGYRQWGADGKVRQLEVQYPFLTIELPAPDRTRTMLTAVEHLDLSTVLKVSQAVQGETDLEKLIATVMRLAVEHAGAGRGLLILPHGDGYRIEAEVRSTHETVTVDLRHASVEAEDLPPSILQYVLRTQGRVLLQDASVASEFADDEYLRRHRVRSVLCMPLLKQTRLAGIIYLENNLATGAFTPARLALLEVLASDAAISLENALLYRNLQERERESRLIVATIPGLVATLTPTGEVEAVTEQVIAYCGQTLEELKQWGTSDTVHPDDRPRVLETISNSIKSGEPYEIVHRIRRFDGVYRWFQVRGLALRDSNGSIVRWYLLLTDIDDLKRAEAELGELKDQLYKENLVLRDEVDRISMFEEIVGTSPALEPVLTRVAKVARTDSTVLITGETGTGKELVARAIHRRSAHASRAFVSVNCAAVPRELIASELFGHEKGAFTGATQRRLGRFELAQGGTLFLDEVGELPMETQVALLRVLQEREFERVGGSASVRVDVRVVAATNRDLQEAIEAGTFRSDLFYRLNVFPIAVPALRERTDDIPLLVEYFIDRYARKAGKTIRRVNKRTLDRLRSYQWPGNVRELQNVIERSVIVCDTDEFTVDESWLTARPALEGRLALSGTVAAHEKAVIEDALRACGGRVYGPSGAAERLGIPRSTLESKIRALRINKSRFRTPPVKS